MINATVVEDTFTPRALDVPGREARRLQAMSETVLLIQAGVMAASPVGVTGLLRSSWGAEVMASGTTITGIVGSPLEYSAVLERGRTPGATMPPAAALEAWVKAKMGPDVSAFVVARSIGRKGFKGREMLLKTLEATRTRREGIWSLMLAEGL